MKIKIIGKKFLNISQNNLLTRGGKAEIEVEIPRYYNNVDLKDMIFILKSVNSEGVYIDCPLTPVEYGVQKIYLKWVPSPTITACEGKIAIQIMVQNQNKELVYQSFVATAKVTDSILASDNMDVCTDTLEEYLLNFRKIYNNVKYLGDILPSDVVTKTDLDAKLEENEENLGKKADIGYSYSKKQIDEMSKEKLGTEEIAQSAKKLEGVESTGFNFYYGTDKNGEVGFHKLSIEGTGSTDLGDYYDKKQIDNLFNTKLDANSVYKKQEIDNIVKSKSDKSEVYTRDYIDKQLDKKATTENVYTKEQTEVLMDKTVAKQDVYTKNMVDEKLDVKADLIGGKVPTEQLPNMGVGEISQTAENSFIYGDTKTNSTFGKRLVADGINCVALGESCRAEGESCVAVSGRAYGFISYDEKEKILSVDEKYEGWSINKIKVGSRILMVSRTEPSKMANVLSINGTHLKIDNEPPQQCYVVLIDTNDSKFSVSKGYFSMACGDSAMAYGNDAVASTDYTLSIGDGSHAKGIKSIAIGNNANTETSYSLALGGDTTTNGGVAVGDSCESFGTGAVSIGVKCYAEHDGACAVGYQNEALGKYSFATGYASVAKYGQTVFGICPVESSADLEKFDVTSEALIIGNSNDECSPGNAFKVTFDGNVYSKSFNNTGADYAEYFQWKDNNLLEEERVGLFVTPDGDRIKIAKQGDLVIGAISGNPGVVGNNPMEWNNKYIRDKFGRLIYSTSKDGNEVSLKINPEWSSTMEYKTREQRCEWGCVGMLGRLVVKDNGRCKVGEYCTVSDGIDFEQGIAVPAYNDKSSKWYVTKRIDENTISIIFR